MPLFPDIDYVYPAVMEGGYTLTGVPHVCLPPGPYATHIQSVRTEPVKKRCSELFAEMKEKGITQMKYTASPKPSVR